MKVKNKRDLKAEKRGEGERRSERLSGKGKREGHRIVSRGERRRLRLRAPSSFLRGFSLKA